MNEVESYLRRSGNWQTPVATDWLGRATKGSWWQTYYSQWLDAHPDSEVKSGSWARGDDGDDWWITETAGWDTEWFHSQGVLPPKRFGDRDNTYWRDYGGGLSGLSYRHAPSVDAGKDAWTIRAWLGVLVSTACVAVIIFLLLLPVLVS